MRQESNKEPALALEVGCVIDAAVYMKKGLESFGKASFPHASKPLFQFASQTRGAALRGLPLWYGVRLVRRFFCGKNEREEAVMRCSQPQLAFPLSRRSAKPARFATAKTVKPFEQHTKAAVCEAQLRSVRSTQKKSLESAGKLAFTAEPQALFRFRLPRQRK